jgi:putative two-component system response regulator
MGRVLVVDDEKSIRITLKAFLSEVGYEVQVAEDAEKAIKMLRETDFDVVVTDIIMPRVTGVDLLKAILEISPDSKVIMMTGEPTVKTATDSLRSEAFNYLIKPIGKDKILESVRRALNVKKTEEETKRR